MEINYENSSKDFGVLENVELIQTWPLPKLFTGLIFIIPTYLILVTKALPSLMQPRAPLQFKRVLLSYNALQVVLSGYTFLIYLHYIYNHGVITTRCPKGADLQEVTNKIFLYFISKHLDLLDTVFFVLRKKDKQVSFLHLFHHTTMLTWSWLHYLYHPCDNFVVAGMLNSFVHILMYTYYALSSLGPRYAKYIWWKKHLTKMQLVQFILALFHMYYQQKLSPCPIPGFFHNFGMTVSYSYFFLFMKFYLDKY